MLFTSLTFLLFLSIVFALYWRLSGRRVQNVALLLASYVFYGWWDYRFLIFIIVSSLVDHNKHECKKRTSPILAKNGF